MKSKLFLTSIIFWILVSIPAIFLSQWFPLDLGGIFDLSSKFNEKLEWVISPYNGSGRYFPFYWLFNSFQYSFFGANVAPYFAVQCVIFLLISFLSSYITFKTTKNIWYSFFISIGFYVSTPVPENFYTLGKAEPLSSLFLMGVLFIFLQNANSLKKNNLFSYRHLIICALFSFALFTKETSIALFGFCISGVVISIFFILKYNYFRKNNLFNYFYLLVSLSFGYLISKLPYFIFQDNLKVSSYTDYTITKDIVLSNLKFYIQQQPDVLIFGILATILLTILGKKYYSKSDDYEKSTHVNYIFMLSMLCMAWAYYLVLFIWRWPMAYYMLLPAAIFRICTAYGLFTAIYYKFINKKLIYTVYAAISLATLYALTCFLYISTSQISYSIIYKEALNKYMTVAVDKKPLIIESYPFYAEQVSSTSQLLLAGTGKDYTIKGIADVLDPAVPNAELLRILGIKDSDIKNNIKNIPTQGDYLLVFTGSKLGHWFLRGVTPFYSEDSLLKMQKVYDMDLISERSIAFPSVYFNIWTDRVTASNTYIGYKLYRVNENEPKFLWNGRYPDGWIEKNSSLLINKAYNKNINIHVSAPVFNLPNRLKIWKNNTFYREVLFNNSDEQIIMIDRDTQESIELRFEVENVVIPENIKINKDKRIIGIRMFF